MHLDTVPAPARPPIPVFSRFPSRRLDGRATPPCARPLLPPPATPTVSADEAGGHGNILVSGFRFRGWTYFDEEEDDGDGFVTLGHAAISPDGNHHRVPWSRFGSNYRARHFRAWVLLGAPSFLTRWSTFWQAFISMPFSADDLDRAIAARGGVQ